MSSRAADLLGSLAEALGGVFLGYAICFTLTSFTRTTPPPPPPPPRTLEECIDVRDIVRRDAVDPVPLEEALKRCFTVEDAIVLRNAGFTVPVTAALQRARCAADVALLRACGFAVPPDASLAFISVNETSRDMALYILAGLADVDSLARLRRSWEQASAAEARTPSPPVGGDEDADIVHI